MHGAIIKIQGGSNMTGTDCGLFTHKSVPVIFEPLCTYHLQLPIVMKSGSLNLLEPSGPVQACNGIAVHFTISSAEIGKLWCSELLTSTLHQVLVYGR